MKIRPTLGKQQNANAWQMLPFIYQLLDKLNEFKPHKHRTVISHVNKRPTIRTNIHQDKNLAATVYKRDLITNEKDD